MADYPDDEELKLIENWSSDDFTGLISFLQENFWMPDWCIMIKGKQKLKVWISTGGWSGNEDRMDSLRKNIFFWSTCWIWHKRGGHFYFEVKNIPDKNKITKREKK